MRPFKNDTRPAPAQPQKVDKEIQSLIDLLCNTTESYSAVLFLAPDKDADLVMYAYQSLSRNINPAATIGPGEGLVGWVHKNGKAVNVDKFDQDTRRLFFYLQDEDIKSFMAVPLPRVNGVLAVDSKNRYVFTEKSQKILHQFGQNMEMALVRLQEVKRAERREEVFVFLSKLERALWSTDKSGQGPGQALEFIRGFSGADAVFLTALLPGNKTRYFISASDSARSLSLRTEDLAVDQGLAGWVMQNKKHLIPDRPRGDKVRSFIFYPEEPLTDYEGFAGFPVFGGGRLRGCLVLASRQILALDPATISGLEMAASRLGSSLETELLLERIHEISRLDPQVGLPHRTYFASRLARQLKMASVKGGGLTLALVKLHGLEELAVEAGQESTREVVKTAVDRILADSGAEWELGHPDYGIIAVSLPTDFESELSRTLGDLSGLLADRPLAEAEVRARIRLEMVGVRFPAEGRRAEVLLRAALKKLAAPETGGG